MKNKPMDLNNHLFAAIERLSDTNMNGDKLEQEIERSRAITGLAKQVIDQQKNVIVAEKLRIEYGTAKVPELLGG